MHIFQNTIARLVLISSATLSISANAFEEASSVILKAESFFCKDTESFVQLEKIGKKKDSSAIESLLRRGDCTFVKKPMEVIYLMQDPEASEYSLIGFEDMDVAITKTASLRRK